MNAIESQSRSKQEILEEIQSLVAEPSYIFALLLIIVDDFNSSPELLHEIDYWNRLNMNEVALLLGFLVKKPIDFSSPVSFESVFEQKHRTRKLLLEMHHSFDVPFAARIAALVDKDSAQNEQISTKEFFGQGEILSEPIFYSGTGVYDFQFLDLLAAKYQYDADWLRTFRGFDAAEVVNIFLNIKETLEQTLRQTCVLSLKDIECAREEFKQKCSGVYAESEFQKVLDILSVWQFVEVTSEDVFSDAEQSDETFRAAVIADFCKNILNLFVIEKSKIRAQSGGESFISNFSIKCGDHLCLQFSDIGQYNVATSHPMIDLDIDRLFLPIPFLLAESIYESPFYWTMREPSYRDAAAENRGKASEEMVFQFLVKVFGDKTHRRVLVKSSKDTAVTDVDVLCVLGSKALCVQVKSKKLTELSKKGDTASLKKDFQEAVQDAYEQAWVARKNLLDRSSRFVGNDGAEIPISEGIDEVYMLIVTTENYPSLTHQAHTLLSLRENSPAPLAFTVFDLELVAHYLRDPYDFLYYIRQRVGLIENFYADEEMVFLGFHLAQRLCKPHNADFCALESQWGQAIDRNYYPFKAGLHVPDDGDTIKARWKDEKFDLLCNEIKKIPGDKVTDIVFHLLDISDSGRSQLVQHMQGAKQKTLKDNRHHDFAMLFDNQNGQNFGVTYFSSETNSPEDLKSRLLVLCKLRKYRCKVDLWLGFGSFKNSFAPLDFVIFEHSPWVYDANLEDCCRKFSFADSVTSASAFASIGNQKVGRNSPCVCGSGKKYKKCCLGK